MSAYLSVVLTALLLLGALQPAIRANIPSTALHINIRAQRLADALNELGISLAICVSAQTLQHRAFAGP
jgi:hypothetical protein